MLDGVTYLNEERLEAASDIGGKEEEKEKGPFCTIKDHPHTSALPHQEEAGNPGRESDCLNQSEEWVHVLCVRKMELDARNNVAAVYRAVKDKKVFPLRVKDQVCHCELAGACLDYGAQRSVCGMCQAKEYSQANYGSWNKV